MPPCQALITGGAGDLAGAIRSSLETAGLHALAPGRRELDVSDAESVKNYLAAAGEIDLLVCNAGLTIDRPLARMTEADWSAVINVNLTGSFRCARECARGMVKRGCGHIIFVSSFSAVHPPVGQANYAAAKSALLGMMKSMARELGTRSIRVNAVLPGFLETKMTSGLPERARQAALEKHTLHRLNTAHCAADFLVFLHQKMPHTSGQVFNLDSRPL